MRKRSSNTFHQQPRMIRNKPKEDLSTLIARIRGSVDGDPSRFVWLENRQEFATSLRGKQSNKGSTRDDSRLSGSEGEWNEAPGPLQTFGGRTQKTWKLGFWNHFPPERFVLRYIDHLKNAFLSLLEVEKPPQHLLDIFLSIPMQVTPLRKLEGSKNNKHDLFKINQDAQITFCQSLGKGSSGSTQSRKRRPCLANWSRLEIDKCGLLELTGAGQLEKAKHKWLCYEYASLSLTKF